MLITNQIEMRITIALITFCFYTMNLFSQDTIVKQNGTKIFAKVTQITPDIIKYKPDGAKYNQSIRTYFVAYIKHENGEIETIKRPERHKKIIADTISKPKKPKLLSPLDEPDYKKHRLCFSVNAFLLDKKEVALYFDYCNSYRHSIGLSIGYEYPNPIFSALLFSFDHLTPFPAYNGIVARLNYKHYFTHSRKVYWSTQILYKSLHYNNAVFSEKGATDEIKDTYRTENATVLGFDFIFGYHLLKLQAKKNTEIFAGIGYRHRIRDYTVLGTQYQTYGLYNVDGRSYHLEQDYPMIILGFKIGINKFFK